MVGFPGETDQDFALLRKYIAKTPYYHLHIFPYSARPGTAAARLADQVSVEIKQARRDVLLALGAKRRRASSEGQSWSTTAGIGRVRVFPKRLG